MQLHSPGQNLRQHKREKIALTCRLIAPSFEMSAVTFDLSIGGAGISCNPAVLSSSVHTVQTLELQGIGTFGISLRWRGTNRIGVAFQTARARQNVKQYLESRNLQG